MASVAPDTIDGLCDAIAQAGRTGARLEITGGGSKAAIGADRDATLLDMRGFDGVVDYDPPELVLTVRAGTPLATVEALVAAENQMLAFEPWDHGPLFGRATGSATIGGVVAAGVSGPRRLTSGGARDHLLGLQAVSGRGEHFVAGSKVVKNVTGYDLPKLLAGSWGRLAAMTELTLKVLPRARVRATMAMDGLGDRAALAAMTLAMGSRADVSAAAHLPAEANGGGAVTLLRLQGFAPSVDARAALLPDLLRDHGMTRRLDAVEAEALWDAVRHVTPLEPGIALWRVNVPPSRACDVVEALGPGANSLFDWAGGLIWIAFDGDPALLRRAVEAAGGHAMLVRAPEAVRAKVPALHPAQKQVAALEERVRRAFDPAGVFETGRFADFRRAD